MAFLNATQLELASGRGVFLAKLVFLDIDGGAKRLWAEFGSVVVDAQTYTGDGSLVSISNIPVDQGDGAGSVTLTLSGVAEWARNLVREPSRVRGREVTIHAQFFDEALAPSDDPMLLFSGEMDTPRYVARGVGSRSIELPLEGDNADRLGAAFAYFSDRDQQARYPGDLGLRFISELGNAKVFWPL